MGKTLIFLKDNSLLDQLDALRAVKIVEHIIHLQKLMRGVHHRRIFKAYRKAALRIQSLRGSRDIAMAYSQVRTASATIQRIGRGTIVRQLWRQITAEQSGDKAPDPWRAARHGVGRSKVLAPIRTDGSHKLDARAAWRRGGAVVAKLLTANEEARRRSADELMVRLLAISSQAPKKLQQDSDERAGQVGSFVNRAGWLRVSEAPRPHDSLAAVRRYVVLNRGTLSMYTDEKAATVCSTQQLVGTRFELGNNNEPKLVVLVPSDVPFLSAGEPAEGNTWLGVQKKARFASAPPSSQPVPAEASESKRRPPKSVPAEASESKRRRMINASASRHQLFRSNSGAFATPAGSSWVRKSRTSKHWDTPGNENGGTLEGENGVTPEDGGSPEGGRSPEDEGVVRLVLQADTATCQGTRKSRTSMGGEVAFDQMQELVEWHQTLEEAKQEAERREGARPVILKEAAPSSVVKRGVLFARAVSPSHQPEQPIPDEWQVWRRLIFMLHNDGRLKAYSLVGGMGISEANSLLEIDLKLFSVAPVAPAEVASGADGTSAAGGGAAVGPASRHICTVSSSSLSSPSSSSSSAASSQLAAGRDITVFVDGAPKSLVAAAQLELASGPHRLRVAAPREEHDQWLSVLQQAAGRLHQAAPIYPSDHVRVHCADGRQLQVQLDELSTVAHVTRDVCRMLGVSADPMWALHEEFEAAACDAERSFQADMLTGRRLLAKERLKTLDGTLLQWESATRKQHGMVAYASSFRLVLRYVGFARSPAAVLQDKTITRLLLAQAMGDLRRGTFTPANRQEVFDVSALALFHEAEEAIHAAERTAAEAEALLPPMKRMGRRASFFPDSNGSPPLGEMSVGKPLGEMSVGKRGSVNRRSGWRNSTNQRPQALQAVAKASRKSQHMTTHELHNRPRNQEKNPLGPPVEAMLARIAVSGTLIDGQALKLNPTANDTVVQPMEVDLDGHEGSLLPAAWLGESTDPEARALWRSEVVSSYATLTSASRMRVTMAQVPSVENTIRDLVQELRMTNELDAATAARLVIERVSCEPLCFCCSFVVGLVRQVCALCRSTHGTSLA